MRFVTLGLAAAAMVFTTVAAEARCTRLGFSVNDYGKIGPTNDAKKLLDGHIAKWAAENGIKKYSTGPKSVTCELYLDLIIFDEYTCKAEANVCWDGPAAAAPADGSVSKKPTDAPKKAPAKEKSAASQ